MNTQASDTTPVAAPNSASPEHGNSAEYAPESPPPYVEPTGDKYFLWNFVFLYHRVYLTWVLTSRNCIYFRRSSPFLRLDIW